MITISAIEFIAASLKQALDSADQARSASFPRSIHRGLIEARQSHDAAIQCCDDFRDRIHRGLIEAERIRLCRHDVHSISAIEFIAASLKQTVPSQLHDLALISAIELIAASLKPTRSLRHADPRCRHFRDELIAASLKLSMLMLRGHAADSISAMN